MASTALANAFDLWNPDFLNRFPTMYLPALSTSSSVKLLKYATASGWRNSESPVSRPS